MYHVCLMIIMCLCVCVFSAPLLDAEAKQYAKVTLEDLGRVETLGMGGFGRVELVWYIGLSVFIYYRLGSNTSQ